MKTLIVLIASFIPFMAYAEKKKPYCPIVVDLSTGKYVSSKNKFRCFANVKAAEKKGYIADTGTPVNVSFSASGNKNTDTFALTKKPSKMTFSHSGTGNFIVRLTSLNGDTELLVNSIGVISDETNIFLTGTFYLDITANGAWSVTIN